MDFNNFSIWRRRFWPIHVSELSRFLPLFFIKFFASFNYTILNATKDTITVTSKLGGAEAIPVLKGGLVIVISFLVMLLYSKLSNKFSIEKIFYIFLVPFLFYFITYAWIFYPARESLSFSGSADYLLEILGNSHKHWVYVYKYWMNSAFFVLAELWGGIMIALLFWGFANQITSVKDAARFYTLYTVGGHLGTILAGWLVYYYAQLMQHNQINFEITVKLLMQYVVIGCIAIIAIFYWFNNNILSKEEKLLKILKKQKTKLSLFESILYIFKSPYLGFIAIMVIAYGLSVNLVEVSWKAILRIQYPNSNDYQSYMGIVQTLVGFTSLFIALFLSNNLIRKYGWYASAQLTPIILGLTSLSFFILYFVCPDFAEHARHLWILVLIGTVHNVLCKAMKYCVFDPTKEMAYIPLEQESKIKGKAAVDLVGSRFGKSGSSWTQLLLIDLVGAGSILGVVPLLIPCVAIIVLFWSYAVHNLNKRFTALKGSYKTV